MGDSKYLISEDGKVSMLNSQKEAEDYLLKAFVYDFFLCLRPSQAYADINTLTK